MEDFRQKLKDALAERRKKDEGYLQRLDEWLVKEHNSDLLAKIESVNSCVVKQQQLSKLQKTLEAVSIECQQLEKRCAKMQSKQDQLVEEHDRKLSEYNETLDKTQLKITKYRSAVNNIEKYMGVKVCKLSQCSDQSVKVVVLTCIDQNDPDRAFYIAVKQLANQKFTVENTMPKIGDLSEFQQLMQSGNTAECIRRIRARFVQIAQEGNAKMRRVLNLNYNSNSLTNTVDKPLVVSDDKHDENVQP